MTEVTFRKAVEEDHVALVKLAKTSKYTKDFSNRVMFSSPLVYEKGWIAVAEVKGQIVGFSCVRHKTRWPETVLYFIIIDEAYRSLKIGEKLIEYVMNDGPHTSMRLNVMKDNEAAKRFYDRLGFNVVGYAINGDAYSMTKEFN
mgnify:CR=1 FL=1